MPGRRVGEGAIHGRPAATVQARLLGKLTLELMAGHLGERLQTAMVRSE
jgi:hypothetical protein